MTTLLGNDALILSPPILSLRCWVTIHGEIASYKGEDLEYRVRVTGHCTTPTPYPLVAADVGRMGGNYLVK